MFNDGPQFLAPRTRVAGRARGDALAQPQHPRSIRAGAIVHATDRLERRRRVSVMGGTPQSDSPRSSATRSARAPRGSQPDCSRYTRALGRFSSDVQATALRGLVPRRRVAAWRAIEPLGQSGGGCGSRRVRLSDAARERRARPRGFARRRGSRGGGRFARRAASPRSPCSPPVVALRTRSRSRAAQGSPSPRRSPCAHWRACPSRRPLRRPRRCRIQRRRRTRSAATMTDLVRATGSRRGHVGGVRASTHRSALGGFKMVARTEKSASLRAARAFAVGSRCAADRVGAARCSSFAGFYTVVLYALTLQVGYVSRRHAAAARSAPRLLRPGRAGVGTGSRAQADGFAPAAWPVRSSLRRAGRLATSARPRHSENARRGSALAARSRRAGTAGHRPSAPRLLRRNALRSIRPGRRRDAQSFFDGPSSGSRTTACATCSGRRRRRGRPAPSRGPASVAHQAGGRGAQARASSAPARPTSQRGSR